MAGWRDEFATYPEYRQVVEEELRRAYGEGVPMNPRRASRLVCREVARARAGKPGLAKPECCSVCGQVTRAPDLHGHHLDYARPLHVVWICRGCHGAEHSGRGSGRPVGRPNVPRTAQQDAGRESSGVRSTPAIPRPAPDAMAAVARRSATGSDHPGTPPPGP
jgi:hypothetical protein